MEVENIFAAFNIFENDCDNLNNNRRRDPPLPEVWIFGYGSLIWHPGFEFSKCITGYIRGYDRRFWQGNVVHRGIENKVSLNCLKLRLLGF